jgi:hypothetical protein
VVNVPSSPYHIDMPPRNDKSVSEAAIHFRDLDTVANIHMNLLYAKYKLGDS